MQIVGLELVRRYVLQQERNQRYAVALRQFLKEHFELAGVVNAVIGRQLHPQQQHLGTGGLCLPNKRIEIFFCQPEWCTAQTVIGTQLNDYDTGLMCFQCCGHALQGTTGGFSADAGVNHLIMRVSALQLLLQQGDPGGGTRNTVSCRQAIAQYQYGGLRAADSGQQVQRKYQNKSKKL